MLKTKLRYIIMKLIIGILCIYEKEKNRTLNLILNTKIKKSKFQIVIDSSKSPKNPRVKIFKDNNKEELFKIKIIISIKIKINKKFKAKINDIIKIST